MFFYQLKDKQLEHRRFSPASQQQNQFPWCQVYLHKHHTRFAEALNIQYSQGFAIYQPAYTLIQRA